MYHSMAAEGSAGLDASPSAAAASPDDKDASIAFSPEAATVAPDDRQQSTAVCSGDTPRGGTASASVGVNDAAGRSSPSASTCSLCVSSHCETPDESPRFALPMLPDQVAGLCTDGCPSESASSRVERCERAPLPRTTDRPPLPPRRGRPGAGRGTWRLQDDDGWWHEELEWAGKSMLQYLEWEGKSTKQLRWQADIQRLALGDTDIMTYVRKVERIMPEEAAFFDINRAFRSLHREASVIFDAARGVLKERRAIWDRREEAARRTRWKRPLDRILQSGGIQDGVDRKQSLDALLGGLVAGIGATRGPRGGVEAAVSCVGRDIHQELVFDPEQVRVVSDFHLDEHLAPLLAFLKDNFKLYGIPGSTTRDGKEVVYVLSSDCLPSGGALSFEVLLLLAALTAAYPRHVFVGSRDYDERESMVGALARGMGQGQWRGPMVEFDPVAVVQSGLAKYHAALRDTAEENGLEKADDIPVEDRNRLAQLSALQMEHRFNRVEVGTFVRRFVAGFLQELPGRGTLLDYNQVVTEVDTRKNEFLDLARPLLEADCGVGTETYESVVQQLMAHRRGWKPIRGIDGERSRAPEIGAVDAILSEVADNYVAVTAKRLEDGDGD
eukprot:Hpha_TRINITY_DN30537_c0_g1::TRINITY_DN30537_c0_g1_i1::g.193565::m.193565